MSGTISGSFGSSITLSSTNVDFTSTAIVDATAKFGVFQIKGTKATASATTLSGAVFGPASLGAVTLVNAGLIAATGANTNPPGAYDFGIVLGHTGSITNSGTITGHSGIGILGTTASSLVDNTGAITGTYGLGIYLQGSGSVVNSGLIAGQNAIVGNYGIVDVQNSLTGTINASNGYGITLNATGVLLNHGSIYGGKGGIAVNSVNGLNNIYNYSTGTITSAGYGISLIGGNFVRNYGFIQAGGGIKVQNAGTYKAQVTNDGGMINATAGVGVYLSGYGFVGNYAGITAKGNGVELLQSGAKYNYVINHTKGSIVSTGGAGVYATGVVSNIANSGFISGTIGIDLNGSTVNGLTNNASATIMGNTGLLVQNNQYVNNAITNYGLITGTAGNGISLSSAGGAVLQNHGSITGTANGIYLAAATGGAGNSVYNYGSIFGARDSVKFAAGSTNLLVLEPGSQLSGIADGGNVPGGAVVSTLELAVGVANYTPANLTGLGTQYINFGTVQVDAYSAWTLSGFNTVVSGQTILNNSSLQVYGSFWDNGLVLNNTGPSTPGTITFTAPVYGTGTIDITANSEVIFNGPVSGVTVDFLSSSGTLVETNPSNFHPNAIIGTGTIIIIPCFAAGTPILTLRGEVPVENLCLGDRVITHDGDDQPIKWIGTRSLDLTRHARPQATQPVRIAKDALANGVPSRDLFLSPDHALYLDGHLVPAKALINQVNVTQPGWHSVTYYHVELDAHGVIFASDTAVETYLETGNRGCFDEPGQPVALHPQFNPEEFQAMREAESCAPFADRGPMVNNIRTRMLDRAFHQQKAFRRAV